ncbi:hypothetical protein F383_25860 [Gossypium arboreum]|uniref:Uncharacterized protein n=1 Tax=Gossypium arboreum TaxID=29729 RepID=A0A0B0P369_GOSAR|nr:hypothetical protein F383_25860 [Gossypium arboreum]
MHRPPIKQPSVRFPHSPLIHLQCSLLRDYSDQTTEPTGSHQTMDSCLVIAHKG